MSDKHFAGQKVDLLIQFSGEDSPQWVSGFVVEDIIAADDREYRLNVTGDGRFYRACAPECVREAQ